VPSPTHEGIVELFRNRRSLAPELLAEVLGDSLPRWSHVAPDESTMPKLVVPNHADLVTLLRDGQGKVVAAVIVEVQLGEDPDKCWVWPLYWAHLRERHRCPAILLVVAIEAAVAAWALATVVDTGPNAGFRPIVLGPNAIPWITDIEVAMRAPELAVLSALAHGNEPGGVEVALAATVALARLDPMTAKAYYDLMQHSLGHAARAALEALLAVKGHEYQSDFAKKYVAQGREEGEARGEARGRAASVLAVLAARGLTVTPEQRERVLSCNDIAALDGWIARAAVAGTTEDVLGS
jgi:hypothetical protein